MTCLSPLGCVTRRIRDGVGDTSRVRLGRSSRVLTDAGTFLHPVCHVGGGWGSVRTRDGRGLHRVPWPWRAVSLRVCAWLVWDELPIAAIQSSGPWWLALESRILTTGVVFVHFNTVSSYWVTLVTQMLVCCRFFSVRFESLTSEVNAHRDVAVTRRILGRYVEFNDLFMFYWHLIRLNACSENRGCYRWYQSVVN